MSGRMREETGLTVPLLRRPPRTPAAFNGRIRDKRERKQELHPSANEIFAVHSRVRGSEGQKEATKTRPPWAPSITKITQPPPSGLQWKQMLKALSLRTSQSLEEETLGFEVKHKAAFFYLLPTFTQEWLRTELVVHLNANEVRPMRSECSEVWSLSPGSSAFHSDGGSRSRLTFL